MSRVIVRASKQQGRGHARAANMQRCEHARAPGSRTLDIAAQALSNRSREQGRGHARTYAVPLHARASMQGYRVRVRRTVDIAAQALS